jgi:superfamily I DNA/RNA helicase
LLLIHNTPIVSVLKNHLQRTRGGVPPNLLIDSFFGWAVRQWWRSFGNFPKIQSSKETERMLWRLRRRYPELKVTEGLLAGELDFINESLFLEAEDYYQASRARRGFLLRLREREKLLELLREATAHLQKQGLELWSAVPRRLCLEGKHERLEKYHHVLIDEAQFFAPSWFQLIKLSSSEDVCIFVCADPNQGFLKRKLSWKSVGLEVAGRTKKLRRSYRTTRAILEAATAVLHQLVAEDPEDFLVPDYAGMHEGSKPLLLYTSSPQDAIERLVNELVEMKSQKGFVLGDLLVIYGDNIPRRLLYSKLSSRLAPEQVWWLNEETQKKHPPGKTQEDYLRMAYLETATGLEASVVFLIGVEALYSEGRLPSTSDEEFAQGREERARKLYMAMTRAGQHLILLSSQRLPGQMEDLFRVLR